jgi:hypothetical protein
MRLPIRDQVATLFVAICLLLYAAWASGMDMPIVSSVSAVALAVLVIGSAGSASAVVPGFAGLLRGSRAYLAAASALGLLAFVAGVVAIARGEPLALGALVLLTLALWAISTIRHMARIRQMPHAPV